MGYLFGIHNSSDTLIKKLNYSLLIMHNYIYKRKLNEVLPDFKKKITLSIRRDEKIPVAFDPKQYVYVE